MYFDAKKPFINHLITVITKVIIQVVRVIDGGKLFLHKTRLPTKGGLCLFLLMMRENFGRPKKFNSKARSSLNLVEKIRRKSLFYLQLRNAFVTPSSKKAG